MGSCICNRHCLLALFSRWTELRSWSWAVAEKFCFPYRNIHASMIRSMFCFGLVCFTSLCFISPIKARFTRRKKPFPSTSNHHIPYPLLLFLYSTLQCHPMAALHLLYRTTVLSLNIQNICGNEIYPPKQEQFGLPDLGFWPGMSLVIGTLSSLARLQSFLLAADLAAVSWVNIVAK